MKIKSIALWQTLFAAGIVLWWALFFFVFRNDPHNSAAYLAFESAFPLPDLVWLTPLLVQAAKANRQASPLAPVWTAAAGGALVFLGLVDFSFNLQHGVYARSLGDGLLNGFINLACVSFGLISVAWSKRQLTSSGREQQSK